MPFPTDAIAKLVAIIKEGLASGNLIAAIKAHWVEAADAIIKLIAWVLDQARPDVVTAAILDHEQAALAGQLLALYQDDTGGSIKGAECGAIPISVWIMLIKWLLDLFAKEKN